MSKDQHSPNILFISSKEKIRTDLLMSVEGLTSSMNWEYLWWRDGQVVSFLQFQVKILSRKMIKKWLKKDKDISMILWSKWPNYLISTCQKNSKHFSDRKKLMYHQPMPTGQIPPMHPSSTSIEIAFITSKEYNLSFMLEKYKSVN